MKKPSGKAVFQSAASVVLATALAFDGINILPVGDGTKKKDQDDLQDKITEVSRASSAVAANQKTPPKPTLPPEYLALKQQKNVKQAIEIAEEKQPTTKSSLVGIYRTPKGQSNQALHNDAQQRRDFASVGKMVTLAIVDDVLKEGKITLDQKLLPAYVREFGLPKDTTVRDAIKATYYYSNNYAAQALLKTAIHKDLGLPDNVIVNGNETADYMLGYMRKNGFVDSAQFNGAGYPEKSDWVSESFSPAGVPPRSTAHSPAELARFFSRKYCQNGDQPISQTMSSLLNLKNAQSPTSVTINHYGLITRQVRTHGLQASAQDYFAYNSNVTSVVAKSGTSNKAYAGMVVVNYKNGTCKVVVGGGVVEDRNATIPEAVAKIDTRKPIVPTPPKPQQKAPEKPDSDTPLWPPNSANAANPPAFKMK